MRPALLITALLASHGTVLWLARNSPPPADASAETPAPPQLPKREPSQLAAFLRSAEAAAKKSTPQEEDTEDPEQPDHEALVAAARAAITPNMDVVAMVKAADPDLPLSPEPCAAFRLWLERDPLAALRFLIAWQCDAPDSVEFMAEFSRHLQETGLAQLGLYLREVPAAQIILLEAAGEVLNEKEPDFALQLAGSVEAIEDRVELLADRFSNGRDLAGQLVAIHRLLGDSAAADFLSRILSRSFPRDPALLAELEQSGIPAYAIAQFRAKFSGSTGGQSRTNADFIGTIAPGHFPVTPEPTGTNVIDGPITRNNIDAFLNNPNRNPETSISTADKIRGYFTSDHSINWSLFVSSDLAGVPGFVEGGEQFLRGKLTGEAWLDALQGAVAGGYALRDELAILAFRSVVEEDPQRALALLSPALPHQEMIVSLPGVSPEVLLLVADRLSGDAGLSEGATEMMAEQFERWFEEDPETYAARVADMPAGDLRERLLSLMNKEEAAE